MEIENNPGVSGLAQLGRNAIERVSELERENAQLRARLAAIDNAPTVAVAVHVYTDRGPYKYLNFAEHDIPASGVELIARPAKEAM